MAEIEEAIAAKDPQRIKRTAHALKGSVGYLNALRVAGLAQQLEALGANGAVTGASELFQALKREIASLTQSLTAAMPELIL
jgi:two-component system, sensor histidine kinase and response regulator